MKQIIISAFGSDKPGIVSQLSGVITSHGGNLEHSRMVKLGSDFTMMILVSVPQDWAESLEVALKAIPELTISTKTTSIDLPTSDVTEQVIDLTGADNEGIVHKVTEKLASLGINIIEMETEIENAPISGTPLFKLNATLQSGSTQSNELQSILDDLSVKLGVEINIR